VSNHKSPALGLPGGVSETVTVVDEPAGPIVTQDVEEVTYTFSKLLALSYHN
jgi:hypothetical protein